MTKFFKHTPQKLGSTTSPTNDLALEVSEAFGKVENLLDTEGTTIISFKEALGNALFSSLKPHKVFKDLSESHTMLENETDIVLENKPENDDIVVYYTIESDGSTQTLDRIDSNKDFTDVNQFKLVGKVVKLNIRVPEDSSLTVSVDYSATTFDLNGKKFLPNVLKKDNEEFFITPSNITSTGFELDFETNLNDTLNERMVNPQEIINFFYSYDRNVFEALEVEDYTISDNSIKILGNNLPVDLVDLEVVAYVNNTSTSELVDALVYEFLNHDHSNNNLTNNISHNDLINRFVNTDKINYKDGEVTNYEHPQYLNREGYNSNLDSVYENAFLGDLFISRVLEEAVQKFKGLDKDSYKIMFGDPVTGPTLKYSYLHEAMMLASVAHLNGLYIKTEDDSNYSLRLNDSFIKSNSIDGLKIGLQNGILDITSETLQKSKLLADKIIAEEAVIKDVSVESFSINNINFSKDPDNNSVTVKPKIDKEESSTLKISAPVEIDELSVDKLVSPNEVQFKKVKSNSINFEDISFVSTQGGNVQVLSESQTNELEVLVPLYAKNIKTPYIEAGDIKPNTITMGDITFAVNADVDDKGLILRNAKPETSTINVEGTVNIESVEANNLKAAYSTLENITSTILKIGGISLYKTVDNNLAFSGSTNKIVFNTVSEFVETKTINQTVENSTVSNLIATSLKIGEVYLRATVDGDIAISSLVNKILITANTLMGTVVINDLLTSSNNILDIITTQIINVGKVSINNVDDDLIIASDTNKLIVNSKSEFANIKAEIFEARTSLLTEMVSEQIKIGEVLLNKTIDDNLIITSLSNKLIIQAITDIDNLSSKSIITEELTANDSNLTNITSKEINIGGVTFAENLNADLSIESSANKVSITAPVEIKKLTSYENGEIDLHTIKTNNLKIGNHALVETTGGDVEFRNTDETRPNSTLSITSTLVSKVLRPYLIEGENASGFLNEIGINALTIGNSVIGNSDGKTVIEPKNPAIDELIINTNTFIRKATIEELVSNEINTINHITKSLLVGSIRLHEDSFGNTIFTSSNSDKSLEFQAATKFLKATITRAIIDRVESAKVKAESVEIGAILFNKDGTTNDVIISNNDSVSKLTIEVPTEILNAKVGSLTTVEKATIPIVDTQSLNIEGFVFKRLEGTRNLVLLNESQDKVEIKTPLTATKFTAEVFSAGNYTLDNNDKIAIDDKNYISNTNNRFEIVNDKTINVVGSSKNSGTSLSHEKGAKPTLKQYISSNSGADAVLTEKNVFVETDVTKGIFLLKPTTSKQTKDSVVYGFNDTTAQINISDLTAWFRNDLFIGALEATSGSFSINEKSKKNGIRIGDTRISVTGIDTDCPQGLTIFESQDTINFVRPLSASQEGCRDVIYQSLNTGPISVEGILSVDGSLAVTEDIIANGTIGATDISLNGNLDAVDVNVGGDLDVKGFATFASEITFKNDVFLNNDLNATGRIKGRSLDVKEDIVVNKSLSVMEDATIERQLTVKGGLNLNAGLTAEGIIKADAISAGDITAQNLSLLRTLEVAGATDIQGRLTVKASSLVEGSLTVNNTLDVKDNVTTQDLYVLRDAVIKERLTVDNGLEVKGSAISIGDANSQITLTGRLQLDTSEVKFNSTVSIYEELKVTGDITSSGEIIAKGGLVSDSYLRVKGAISTDSSITTQSTLTARTVEVSKNLSVENSITADNITSESISVANTASIANLTISKSLSMPIDTSIVAGDVKFSSILQTNPSALNSFSGRLTVSGGAEFLKGIEVGQNISFNNNSVILNSNGLTGASAKINVATLTADAYTGNENIQTPNHLAVASNTGAAALGRVIPQRKFARIDNLVSDGVAVFNQALTADTIYYKSLIYAGKSDNNAKGAVDITAMRALYS